MTNKFDLRNKTALITGSTRGLGLALATALGEAGARIVLHGRDEDRAIQVREDFTQRHIECDYVCFDLTNPEATGGAVEKLKERHGSIDILVNNAGIQRRGKLEEITEEDWAAVLETNLTGVWRIAKYVVPLMIEAKGGKIINIASLMSFGGRETTGPYTASKGGVAMLTKAMCVEWARHNIQVNAIAPGYFLTDMTRPLTEDPAFDGWVKMRTPAERWGNPEELGGAAIFLASSASSFVNGQILYVDGGWSSKL